MVCAKRETNREIVNAQGNPGEEQPASLLLTRRRVGCRGIGPHRLAQPVYACDDQQSSARPARSMSEGAGQTVPERWAQDRHPGLEDPEYHAGTNAGPGIDTSDADTDRGGEVRQA